MKFMRPTAKTKLLFASRKPSLKALMRSAELEEMNLSKIRRLKRLLPKEAEYILPRAAEGFGLSYFLLRYHSVRLQVLDGKLDSATFSSEDIEALSSYIQCTELMTAHLSSVSNVGGAKGILLRELLIRDLKPVLTRAIQKAKDEMDKHFPSAKNSFPRLSLEDLTEPQLDFLTFVIAGMGRLDGHYQAQQRPSYDGNQLKAFSYEFSLLHPWKETEPLFQPTSPLFTAGLIDIEGKDEIGGSWHEVSAFVPDCFLEKEESTSSGTNSVEVIDPADSIDEVSLPSKTWLDLNALCEQYRKTLKKGRKDRLTFLFYGPPGTGKTMTSLAIGNKLGMKVMKITCGSVKPNDLAARIAVYCARAQKNNYVLVFDECEDLFSRNPFLGISDGWAKAFFEKFEGVAVFTTNYQLPKGMERRMTYVTKFSGLGAMERAKVLQQELQRHCDPETKLPNRGEIRSIVEEIVIPAGYYRQAIQLASAHSQEGTIEASPLKRALETIAEQVGGREKGALEPKVRLKDLELSQETQQVVKHFDQWARQLERSKNPLLPSGATMLMDGPPGTGKTALAEAIAHELGLKFRRCSPSHFLSMFVGGTETKIREIFQEAEQENQLLFIDEAEGLFLDRRGARASWERTQADELLQQMERFRGTMIAATNFPEMMDMAFSRRFLFHLRLTMPNIDTRQRIWEKWKGTLALPDGASRILAEKYELSPGEIRNVAVRAKTCALHTLSELERACEDAKRSRTGLQWNKMGLLQ
jgi:SpoVK/Ycf46/Vps4 family AAA+-type ATPase